MKSAPDWDAGTFGIINYMPLINIEYDDKSLTEVEAESLSQAVRDIVSKVTDIHDVFVYTNTAKIKYRSLQLRFL